MVSVVRRLLTFSCEGAELGATLDSAEGTIGLLMATGGTQSRIGSHRMYERLAKSLSEQGISCLRFDRRGVGDSGGEDPGFRGSGSDLAAAAALLRAECPALTQIHGLGLCDGATALALFGDQAGLAGLILVNPWLVEAASGEPPPAAIRRHYRDRLFSLEGWKSLLFGGVDYRKLLRGILKILAPGRTSTLAQAVAAALARHGLPTELILATGDATAIAAESEMKGRDYSDLSIGSQKVDTDSHTFARPGDDRALLDSTLAALGRLDRE